MIASIRMLGGSRSAVNAVYLERLPEPQSISRINNEIGMQKMQQPVREIGHDATAIPKQVLTFDYARMLNIY